MLVAIPQIMIADPIFWWVNSGTLASKSLVPQQAPTSATRTLLHHLFMHKNSIYMVKIVKISIGRFKKYKTHLTPSESRKIPWKSKLPCHSSASALAKSKLAPGASGPSLLFSSWRFQKASFETNQDFKSIFMMVMLCDFTENQITMVNMLARKGA